MNIFGIRKFIPYFFIIDLVLLDQGTKWAARKYLESPLEVWPNFQLFLTENSGIAFSLPAPRWGLVAFTILFVGFFSRWMVLEKNISFFQKIGGIFLLSGAIGNLIDRIIFGAVTDFFAFWSFPIFNFADIFVTLGMVFFLWDEFFRTKKKLPEGSL